jgi:hypothetical protein
VNSSAPQIPTDPGSVASTGGLILACKLLARGVGGIAFGVLAEPSAQPAGMALGVRGWRRSGCPGALHPQPSAGACTLGGGSQHWARRRPHLPGDLRSTPAPTHPRRPPLRGLHDDRGLGHDDAAADVDPPARRAERQDTRHGPKECTQFVQTSGLRNFSAHAPGPRLERERAIVASSEQALAHASFELLAALLRERYDKSAPRTCAFRERLPIVVER